ncbi:hypothetical protein I3843_01G080800 [Carya illinoinensis]|nr:hypothetical protein I3843_01G080800 [Carya illinoinensis]
MGCHDETLDSKNQGNFLEMLKLLASYNDKVGKSVSENAQDESKREQMAIILRFVDVDDISALTLKNEISAVLSRHYLGIQNIHWQGYDGATVQATHIAHMIAIDELESEKGANQIGTINRASDSHWGSHFYSICSLLRMFEATWLVLETIIKEGSTYSQRGDANAAYKMITLFQFIFILHLMRKSWQKTQDILNVMNMVSITKGLIQKLRNESWKNLLENIVSFSKKFDRDIPELSSRYIQSRGRHQQDHITIELHYHFEIFNVAINFQMQELDNRFGEGTTKLLTLNSALDPKNGYKSFNIDNICCLVEEYYPLDFSENEKINLMFQLKHFEVDVLSNPKFQDLRSITDVCRRLVETEKSKIYYLIDRLIRLILTFPVSTATSERTFSVMKIVKTGLRNKIEDEFLANNLVVYIEREIAKNFDLDSTLDNFVCLKELKLQF